MRSGSTAVRYLKELRRVIRFYGISNANMEEGSFRCEVNISLRPVGTEDFGTKVEIKNLNSFRAVERSIDYEIKRQTEILNKREIVRHETRGWDDKEGVTVHQRFKERAPEYRYFPEPDLPDLHLTDTISEEALIDLEELPVRQVRGLIERFGVPPQSAELLMSGIGAPVEDPYYVGEFFEKCIDRHGGHGTLAVNLITGIIFEHLNKENTTLDQTVLTPKKLAEVTKMVARDEVSSTNAKLIVARILKEGGDVREIVVDEGLVQVSDEDELVTLVREVIEENESIVEEIKRGKINAIGSLVGTAMKKSDGQANPKRVNELLHEILLPKKHK
jgi:aspartyl-tRNA(Asn)/glutamyl-tRNA(Gln) amidotransferase subunit B